MDVERDWARIVEAAADPRLTRTPRQRVSLLADALGMGTSITPDSVASSVTVSVGEGYVTPAASNGIALDLDLAQYVDREGPCVDACRDGEAHHILIMSEEQAYPRFTATALEHGVRSSLSLPLPSRPAAALNLYAASTNAFADAKARAAAALLARCLVNFLPEPPGRRPSPASEITAVVERRRLIQRANRQLAAAHRCSEADAFSIMASRSRAEGRSIFDVANDVLTGDTGDTGDTGGTDGGAQAGSS